MKNPTQPIFREGAIRVVRDIPFATRSSADLALDLYLPTGEHSPATVYFHGGGWRTGTRRDRADIRCGGLARRGIAVASVDYRLTPEAVFPAQMIDARAAIDWLRDNGGEYGLDVERIGAWGASAGGHLAALLGTREPGESNRESAPVVAAVATLFAPLLIGELLANAPGLEHELLPGASVDLIQDADPFERIDAAAASFLLFHGDADPLIAPDISARFHGCLKENGVESMFVRVAHAGHEDERFESDVVLSMIAAFFREALA